LFSLFRCPALTIATFRDPGFYTPVTDLDRILPRPFRQRKQVAKVFWFFFLKKNTSSSRGAG
jgi:hypothetical protein